MDQTGTEMYTALPVDWQRLLRELVFVNSAPSSERFHLPKQHDPPVICTACQPAVSSSGLSFCQNNEAAPFEARQKEVLKTCSCQNIDGFLAYVIMRSSLVCFIQLVKK